jgi:hypothetical protein
MARDTQTKQSGSVASFLVVGLVLVALVGGGIYLLKHRSDTNSIKVAKTSTLPSASVSTTVTPKKSSKPSPHSTPIPTPVIKTTQPAAKSSAPTPATMPVTGPSDLMPAGIVMAILVSSAASFVQSERARRRVFNQ